MTQLRIPAAYMRGGTGKGVFFHKENLPADPAARDRLLLRVIGSPDPYGKQIDGMGAATSSTSKADWRPSQHAKRWRQAKVIFARLGVMSLLPGRAGRALPDIPFYGSRSC